MVFFPDVGLDDVEEGLGFAVVGGDGLIVSNLQPLRHIGARAHRFLSLGTLGQVPPNRHFGRSVLQDPSQ